MTDADAVTDSTDWLETPLAALAPLESSLRCQVCKEVFTTPMITSCSHTFCSLCIRRYLSQEGKCPSCRTPDQEMKLRHNWAVQELVEIWSENRAKIFDFAKSAAKSAVEADAAERPRKRRKVEPTGGPAIVVQKSGLEERRSTRSQSRRVASQASQDLQTLPSTQEEIPDSDAGSVYAESPEINRHFQAPEPNDGLVGCPNCNRRMKEALINAHLDKCLQGLASPTPPPPPAARRNLNQPTSPTRGLQAGTIAYTTTKSTTSASTLQRLPTMNYSLLNESSMRRKLKDLGIPNQGNKEQMRKRHIEWMNLWNANCDSLRPVSKRKLLDELDRWERNLGRDERQRLQQGGGGLGGAGGGGMMDKDFDREGHMKKEREGFEDLIRKARESRKAKPAAKEEDSSSADKAADASVSDAHSNTASEMAKQQEALLANEINGDRTMTNGDTAHAEAAREEKPATTTTETLVPSTPPQAAAVASNQTIDLVTPDKPDDQRTLVNGPSLGAQEMSY